MTSRHKRRVWAVLPLAAVLLTAGCMGLPDTGPVVAGQRLDVVPVGEPVNSRPDEPRDGASPEDTVRGFIRAGDDTDETHAVAKMYLAPSSVDLFRWSSRDVVVYRQESELKITRKADDIVEVSVSPLGYLSPEGRYRDAAPGTVERATFGVTKVTGEWRLSLPRSGSGIWLDARGFNRLYVSQPIHFVSRTGRELVPDVRWFLNSRRLATSLTRAQLGPVPEYLQGAVRTAVPTGTKLAVDAVPISEGHATLELTKAALEAGPDDRLAMAAQLSATLGQLSVSSISLASEGATLELPNDVTTVTTPSELGYDVRAPEVAPRALLRQGTRLTWVGSRYAQDTEFGNRGGVQDPGIERFPNDVPTQWQTLAVAVDGHEVAAVGGDRKEISRWPDNGRMMRDADVGSQVTRPTYDYGGYLWFASADASGRFHLWAIDTNVGGQAKPTMVRASWLDHRKVLALTVSPDRARVLVVSTGADGRDSQLHVAGVVRTSAGAPTALAEPLRLAETLTTIKDVVWLGAWAYAVLGRSLPTESTEVWSGAVGGSLEAVLSDATNRATVPRLPAGSPPVALTTVDGRRGIRVVTADGKVLARVGSTWPTFAEGTELLVPGR